MLHHRRQLDREGLRQRADGCAVFAFEPGENRPPSRVDERRKCPVEPATQADFLLCFARDARNAQLISEFVNETKATATGLIEELTRSWARV
jgi:hypothetical protein